MPDLPDDGFLARWSRRKRTSAEEAPSPPETPPETAVIEVAPESLPDIESLGAHSDYRAFLRKGVPAELRHVALRRAWASDPLIAEFRGFGEYDWDFNAPGYGALLPDDDVERLARAVFGDPEPDPAEADAPESDAPPGGAPAPEEPTESSDPTEPVAIATAQPAPFTPPVAMVPPLAVPAPVAASARAAPLPQPVHEPAPPRARRHGGAVPV